MSGDQETASARPVVALFDFDGTITYFDSFLPFLRSTVGFGRFWGGIVMLLPAIAGRFIGKVPNWRLKELFLTQFLGGWTQVELDRAAVVFAGERLPMLVNPVAMERVAWHKEQGHRLVLLSASPDVYLRPWAAAHGFHEVLATRLQFQEGRVSGRLSGMNCHGPEKVARAEESLGPLGALETYGYGDSRSDRHILGRMSHSEFKPFGASSWNAPRRLAAARWIRSLLLG